MKFRTPALCPRSHPQPTAQARLDICSFNVYCMCISLEVGTRMELNQAARQVLDDAAEEARRLNHNYVGTEHELLGLLRDEEGAAGRALRRLGVDLDEARAAVEHVVGRGDRMVTGDI